MASTCPFRAPFAGLLFSLVAATVAGPGASAASIDGLAAEAAAAKQRGDFPAMAAALQQALLLRPDHPRWRYHLAVARANSGARFAAMALLEQVAAQGIAYQPDTDADLAVLRDEPRFSEIAARFAANRAPQGTATVAFTLADRALIPESIVCRADRVCFVSSVHRRSITRVAADGTATNFVSVGRDGLDAALGLALDERRGRLWVASAALPEMEGYAPALAGRTGVYAFALDDGRLLRRVMLEPNATLDAALDAANATPGTELAVPALGDLRVLADGSVLASDQQGGALYLLAPDGKALRRLTAPGALRSPQGVVVDADGRRAWVADWSLGLMRVDLGSGAVERARSAAEVCSYGIDGLYRHGRDLIAVQNGIRPARVVRFSVHGERIIGQTVLVANDPRFSEPTLGAVLGDRFLFIANSQWDRFDADHRLPPEAELAAPLVLEVPLR